MNNGQQNPPYRTRSDANLRGAPNNRKRSRYPSRGMTSSVQGGGMNGGGQRNQESTAPDGSKIRGTPVQIQERYDQQKKAKLDFGEENYVIVNYDQHSDHWVRMTKELQATMLAARPALPSSPATAPRFDSDGRSSRLPASASSLDESDEFFSDEDEGGEFADAESEDRPSSGENFKRGRDGEREDDHTSPYMRPALDAEERGRGRSGRLSSGMQKVPRFLEPTTTEGSSFPSQRRSHQGGLRGGERDHTSQHSQQQTSSTSSYSSYAPPASASPNPSGLTSTQEDLGLTTPLRRRRAPSVHRRTKNSEGQDELLAREEHTAENKSNETF